MKYSLATTRNELLVYATAWMKLENICQTKDASHKRQCMEDSIYMKCPE